MRKINYSILIFLFFLLVGMTFSSCRPSREKNVSGEVVIRGIDSKSWTYFSFSSGEVVGKSLFGDADEDKSWGERRDWDFAVCGDFIKTNSGTSGVGLGGVQINTTSTFDNLVEAPIDSYSTDTLFIHRQK